MRRGRSAPGHPRNNAEPGTGSQYHVVADEDGETYHHNGEEYIVGRDYLDIDVRDVAELTAVVRKSSWCDTGPAEAGTLIFRMAGERIGQYKIKPANLVQDPDRDDLCDRLHERYQEPKRTPGQRRP